MIHIEQAEATDLETIINIQRAISRLFMRNIMISMTLIWKIESGSSGSWWNVLIAFIILSRMMRKCVGLSVSRPTMSRQSVGWEQRRFCPIIKAGELVQQV